MLDYYLKQFSSTFALQKAKQNCIEFFHLKNRNSKRVNNFSGQVGFFVVFQIDKLHAKAKAAIIKSCQHKTTTRRFIL